MCALRVPLIPGFPLFPAILPFKLLPLQLGFLLEVGCVVTLEVVTLSLVLSSSSVGVAGGMASSAEYILALSNLG